MLPPITNILSIIIKQMLSWVKDKIKGVKGEEDCLFCKIRDNPTDEQKNKSKQFLYEDQQFFVINDIKKASAREHILILTKKHYRSALQIKDKNIFIQMKQIGTKVLEGLKQNNHTDLSGQETKGTNQQLRFGFHIPPNNSIDHIHLHGFLLPFTQWKYDKLVYGWLMTSVDYFIKK